MADFIGDGGDNSILGTSDGDTIDVSQGGEDTVDAGDGDDDITAGGALDAGDHIDGGLGGADALTLDGDYSLVFSETTLTDVEQVILGPGHDYDLTLADAAAVVQGDGALRIFATELTADDHLRIDTSALQSGRNVLVIADEANVTLTGGAGIDRLGSFSGGRLGFDGAAGDDSIDLSSPIGRHDRLDGGDGSDDQLILENGGVDHLTGKVTKGFENIILVNGDFDVIMADFSVGFGGALEISAGNVHIGQHLVFDASAERSGAYSVFGGQDADTITGGRGADFFSAFSGDDVLIGGRGGDQMFGGSGADSFVYVSIADSGHHKSFDLIGDLESGDQIDLSAIDARTDKDGDQAFRIVQAFTGHAGELTLTYDGSENLTSVSGDVNGDGKADITIHITGDHTDFSNFVL